MAERQRCGNVDDVLNREREGSASNEDVSERRRDRGGHANFERDWVPGPLRACEGAREGRRGRGAVYKNTRRGMERGLVCAYRQHSAQAGSGPACLAIPGTHLREKFRALRELRERS